MKTNIASIETVIDILLEKDNTYRIAVQLLNSFNKNTKKTKQQLNSNLKDKSGNIFINLQTKYLRFWIGDISDHDHTVFNILIKDRINRLRK